MPVLVVYIGSHDISALVYKSPEAFTVYSYPFVYSRSVYSNYFDISTYYKAVFEFFCKQSDVTLEECELLVTGFLEPPQLNFGLKMFVSLNNVLKEIVGYDPLVVNNNSIVSTDKYTRLPPIKSGNNRFYSDSTLIDFYSNLSVFPHIVPTELSTRIDLDTNLAKIMYDESDEFNLGKSVIFCGSRFSQPNQHKELDYILMLSLLSQKGIVDIYLDRYNFVILKTLLSMYKTANFTPKYDPERIGTLISFPSALSCLITSESGTSQIVDMDNDRIFVIPSSQGESANIMIKGPQINNFEKRVMGGSLGIIFDTRKIKGPLTKDKKLLNDTVRVFSELFGTTSIYSNFENRMKNNRKESNNKEAPKEDQNEDKEVKVEIAKEGKSNSKKD